MRIGAICLARLDGASSEDSVVASLGLRSLEKDQTFGGGSGHWASKELGLPLDARRLITHHRCVFEAAFLIRP